MITVHEVGTQGIGLIASEIVCAVIGSIGRCTKLCLFPVFVQRFASYSCRDIQVAIGLETMSGKTRFTINHILIIGHVHHTEHRASEVGALVRAVERTVTVMIIFPSGSQSPLVCQPIGEMECGTEIDEPSRTDEFIVNAVGYIIFFLGLSCTETEGIICHPFAGTKEWTRE